jgi:hypothetical protein
MLYTFKTHNSNENIAEYIIADCKDTVALSPNDDVMSISKETETENADWP